MMVGFMEPVGTSFQSAMAERNANMTNTMINRGLASSRRNLVPFCFQGVLFFIFVRETAGIYCSIKTWPGVASRIPLDANHFLNATVVFLWKWDWLAGSAFPERRL